MDDSLHNLFFQAIDETISDADFERLQDAIEADPEVRTEYLRTVRLCESLGNIAATIRPASSSETFVNIVPKTVNNRNPGSLTSIAAAAAILMLVGGVAYWLGQQHLTPVDSVVERTNLDQTEESLIAGHAALRRSVDVKWPDGAAEYREGDILPNGRLQFETGLAEIDFFCGASLIIEGPATLDIESDWSATVVEGRLRANVPPAARGFVIKVADSQIIDLGTEFAVEVGSEMARVEVLDGEVELRGGKFDGDHLITGQSQLLKGTQSRPEVFKGLTTVSDVHRLRSDAESQRFADWKLSSNQLADDERLLAYYPIATTLADRVVGNASQSGTRGDAQLVGPVNREFGRFGSNSTGLEFNRPGARVRTRIDGDFNAYSFACWVKIDSLEHVYNALFMSDGYETGELHWQIHHDGRLMFSVMVDDSKKIRHYSEFEKGLVESAGLAKIYYTEPFWDISQSGRWFHLAAVYDPQSRRVEQYVNGKQLSSEEIPDRFTIDTLKIGPAEIGNWGQPFRRTPWFSVRNLHGTIDELMIFNTAVTSDEIKSIYEQGKPLGY